MNTSPAALTATFWGWSRELSAAGKPAGPAKPRPAMPVPAMRRMTPAGVTSRTAVSPLSAMNTSPLASTAVPPGVLQRRAGGGAAVAVLAERRQRPRERGGGAAGDGGDQVGAGVGHVDGAAGGGHADRVVQAAAR